MHGVHHVVEGRIEELLGGFGIEAPDEFRRVFEVGKEHRDLLAFPFQGTAGGEDFLREIGRGVGEGDRAGVDAAAGAGGEAVSPVQTRYRPTLIDGKALALNEFDLR